MKAQGPEQARGLLRKFAEKDQPARAEVEAPAGALAGNRERSPAKGLLGTLGEIAGLGPLIAQPPAHPNDRDDPLAIAAGEAADHRAGGAKSAASESFDASAEGAAAKKAEADEDAKTHGSLVSKSLEYARTRGAEENARSAADQFITIVIEFAIPDPKPPSRTN